MTLTTFRPWSSGARPNGKREKGSGARVWIEIGVPTLRTCAGAIRATLKSWSRGGLLFLDSC